MDVSLTKLLLFM